MAQPKLLYRTASNPLLIKPGRSLPAEVAVIGAGTIGPDIGYYLKSSMPGCRLDLMAKAVQEVNALQGNLPRLADGAQEVPLNHLPDVPRAGSQVLSREAVATTIQTIAAAAGAVKLADALEIGCRGFGEIACTEAAREGISAFLERRKPVFKR